MIISFIKKERVIFEKETKFNRIVIADTGDRLKLYLDETKNTHSIYMNGRVMTGSYWDLCAISSLFKTNPNILILGLGAGTIARIISKISYAKIFGVDIDEEVIKIGKKYFDMPDIYCIVSDYLNFLEFVRKKFDIIIFDIFRNADLPKEIFSINLLKLIRQKTDILVVNVADKEKSKYLSSLLKIFFQITFTLKSPESFNFIVFAIDEIPILYEKKIDALCEDDKKIARWIIGEIKSKITQ